MPAAGARSRRSARAGAPRGAAASKTARFATRMLRCARSIRGRAVADHAARDRQLGDEIGDRRLAGGVEIGRALVEHQHRWLAVEGARQQHALPLSARTGSSLCRRPARAPPDGRRGGWRPRWAHTGRASASGAWSCRSARRPGDGDELAGRDPEPHVLQDQAVRAAVAKAHPLDAQLAADRDRRRHAVRSELRLGVHDVAERLEMQAQQSELDQLIDQRQGAIGQRLAE